MFKMLFKTLLKPPSKKMVTVYSLASGVVVVPVVMLIGLQSSAVMAQMTENNSLSKLYSLDNLGKDPLTSLSAFGLTPRADYRGKITGDFMWLNSYKAEEGGEIINSISLTWGLPNSTKGSTGFSDWKDNPRIASLLLYGDPNEDGNPNDARLLAQSDVLITDPDTDILTKVMVTPTQFTVGQNFFVAALVRNLERIPNADPTKTFGFQSPATAELSKNPNRDPSKQGRSWYAIGNHGDNDPSNFDLNDLGKNFAPNGGQSPIRLPDSLNANWVLRAEGQAVPRRKIPEPTMTFGLLGMGILKLMKRRRSP
jgi:hypothetical protein